MSIYDQNDTYRSASYQNAGYRPSGAGILTIVGAAIVLGLSLIIALSFIYGSSYDGMRGGNDVDASLELPQVNQPQQGQATPYLPDARSPDLGTNTGGTNGQQNAPAAP